MKRRMLSISALIIFLTAGAVLAQPMESLPGTNVALGKPATFSLAPNYSYCKGGDETDLTDGKFWQAGGKTGFWVETGTVGWSFGRQPGVLITFDLGRLCAIDTISFDSASGAAQVTFPAALMVYVSDDGKSWRYVRSPANAAKPGGKASKTWNCSAT